MLRYGLTLVRAKAAPRLRLAGLAPVDSRSVPIHR